MNVHQIAVHDHRSKTILDRFVLADTPNNSEFSVLTAFHTLSMYFPLPHISLPHCQAGPGGLYARLFRAYTVFELTDRSVAAH